MFLVWEINLTQWWKVSKTFWVVFIEITNISLKSVDSKPKIICIFASRTVHLRGCPSSLTKRKLFLQFLQDFTKCIHPCAHVQVAEWIPLFSGSLRKQNCRRERTLWELVGRDGPEQFPVQSQVESPFLGCSLGSVLSNSARGKWEWRRHILSGYIQSDVLVQL